MEQIQVSEERIMSLFAKRRESVLAYAGGGALGVMITAIFGMLQPSFAFFLVAVFFTFIKMFVEALTAQRKIEDGEYQAFKIRCTKTRRLSLYVFVKNNEILSQKPKKPMKRIEFAGNIKLLKNINARDDIVVIKTGKKCWAFSLDDV